MAGTPRDTRCEAGDSGNRRIKRQSSRSVRQITKGDWALGNCLIERLYLVSFPPSSPRKHLHTRQVRFDGYHRDDGLWDIEATLTDAKAYVWRSADKGELPPGTPIHDMVIRLTLDDALTIKAIATAMPGTPHGECSQANDPMQIMVGQTIGAGWRMTIEKNLGGIKGCTHLRELLFNMATAAYQTIPGYRAQLRREAGLPAHNSDQPPFYLGKCLGWNFDGPAVLRHYPQFVGWQPLKQMTRDSSTR